MLNTAIFSRVRTAARPFCQGQSGQYRGSVCDRRRPDHQLRRRRDRLYPCQQRPVVDAGCPRFHRPDAGERPADGTITASEINTKAQDYFKALYTNTEARAVTVTATYTANTGKGSTIKVNGSGNVPTEFMRSPASRTSASTPVRPRPGATSACGSRWRSTSPGRWTTTARWPR